jgi:transcriptional regulator with XRE-family HTH domain
MITPEQCRAARAWLEWSQEDLAERAKVALSTVRDFEKDRREPIANNIVAIQSVLESAGIQFFSEALGPAGVRYEGRIKERDTYVPVLKFLDDTPDGFMKTADLIKALEAYFAPKGEDAEILKDRSDTKFSQIVRNIVSHRDSAQNLIGAGWAEYNKPTRGLRITPAGRFHLQAEEERGKQHPYSRA